MKYEPRNRYKGVPLRHENIWNTRPNTLEITYNRGYIDAKGFLRPDGFAFDLTEKYIKDYQISPIMWGAVYNLIYGTDSNLEVIELILDRWSAVFPAKVEQDGD